MIAVSPRLPIALPVDQQVRCDCGSIDLEVIDSYRNMDDSIYRRRKCKTCGQRITTQEYRVPSTRRHVARETPALMPVGDSAKRAH